MVRFRTPIMVGITGILIASFYLCRSELILGNLVRSKIENVAKKRGIEIEIQSMEPVGFISFSLNDVALRFTRKNMDIELFANSIVLTPTYRFSSKTTSGGFDLSEMIVKNATLSASPEKKKTRAKYATNKVNTTTKTKNIKLHTRRAKRQIHFEKIDIVHSELKAPFRILNLDAFLEGEVVKSAIGFGRTPDGIDCVLDYNGRALKIEPEEKTHLDKWTKRDLPSITLSKISICPSCKNPGRIYDLTLGTGTKEISSDHVDIVRSGNAYELIFGEVVYGDFPARILNWRMQLNLQQKTSKGRITIGGVKGGKWEARWSYDKVFEMQTLATEFELEAWKEFNPFPQIGHLDSVSGGLDIRYDFDLQHVELHSSLKLKGITIQVDRIAKDPVTFPKMGLRGDVLIDLPGRSLSLTEGQIELESSDPILVNANIVGAENGVVFSAKIDAARLNAVVIRDALPKSMTHVIHEANIDGDFGFNIEVGGHSAFPESLYLNGDISGEVNVLKDGPGGNIQEIKTGPLRGFERWFSLPEDDDIIALTITAAEDAAFFSHSGFDWKGVRRAMVHNLKVGRLERGASTISQQVAKNVFLSGNRTASRKLQEMFLTWRLEDELSKNRILEIYLNIASWGVGIKGISQASQAYFGVTPGELDVVEVALLAAILPNPARFGGAFKRKDFPASRVEKMEHILNNLRFIGRISYAEYTKLWGEVKVGEIGRLKVNLCNDGAQLELLNVTKKCSK